ncbi:MAG: Flp pilus assembly complex ATPase component [Verrucomicrobiota bacterium]|jgi:twitching motility protein PilT
MPISIDDILQAAEDHGASDIFLQEGEIPRMKIHEQLMLFGDEKLMLPQMAGLWQACGADTLKDLDVDTGITSRTGVRFRVNLHKVLGRLAGVLRRVRTDMPSLSALGAPEWLLTRWGLQEHGLVLVTGSTGQGKSTTLAGLLHWMNENAARHVVTIEDPVEFIFTNNRSMFTQREVGRDTPSFPRGLRAAMRQAPDVIFVGEIRDYDTAFTALQACETGHLVLASMHSATVADTMERFVNLFPADQVGIGLHLLSHQLIGVLCQKLVPDAQGHLTLLVEHLQNGGAVRDWIARRQVGDINEYMSRANDPNCRTFLQSIVSAYEQGIIDEATAIASCGNEAEFRRAARGIS